MATVNVHLDLEPYLTKFLHYYMKKNDMQISKDDLVGPIVLSSIKSKPRRVRFSKNKSITLKVLLHPEYTEVPKPYISPKHMMWINSQLKREYEMVFFSYIMIGFGFDKEKIIVLITKFREKYDINESDLSFEASKKAFYRLRLRAKIDLSKINNLAICPLFSDFTDWNLSKKR